MILIDINVLLYAYNDADPRYPKARAWLEKNLAGPEHVCFDWHILNGFIRISTNPRIFVKPLVLDRAIEHVQDWLEQPCVRVIGPTEEHWAVFSNLLRVSQASANLVSDAHIAALAIEYGCELQSTDADFSRFPKLKWRNPLK